MALGTWDHRAILLEIFDRGFAQFSLRRLLGTVIAQTRQGFRFGLTFRYRILDQRQADDLISAESRCESIDQLGCFVAVAKCLAVKKRVLLPSNRGCPWSLDQDLFDAEIFAEVWRIAFQAAVDEPEQVFWVVAGLEQAQLNHVAWDGSWGVLLELHGADFESESYEQPPGSMSDRIELLTQLPDPILNRFVKFIGMKDRMFEIDADLQGLT